MRARVVRFAAAFQALLLMATLVVPALAAATEISTDLWIYNDGDTVTVTGVDFGADEVVDFITTDPEGVVVDTGSANSDASGGVVYAFILNVTVGGIYTVVATGRSSSLTATTQFDPPNNINTTTTLTVTPAAIASGASTTLAGTLAWTAGTYNQGQQSKDGRTIHLIRYTNASCSTGATPISDVTTSGGGASGTASYSFNYTPAAAGTQFIQAKFDGFILGSSSTQDTYRDSTSACVQLVVDAAPTVTSTTPTNGATNVALNADVVVAFSESVSAGSAISISCTVSGAHPGATTGSPGSSITFNPTTDFANNETCTVTVAAASVTDTDAIDPPNNMAADYVFSFGTADAAPAVTGTSPTDGATGVLVGANIVITFSESVTVETSPMWITVDCPSGAHLGVTSGGGTSWTFDPTVDFASSETCDVQVKFNRVHDTDLIDPPDELDGHYDFSFTTAVSNTAPVLTVPPSPVVAEATSSVGASVTFSVSATDAEDNPDPTPTCDWDSGDTFPIGNTLVSCSVTDSGGLSDSGSFTVTVEDTTDPSVAITTTESDNGAGWFNLASNDGDAGLTIDVSVTDAVGATSLVCTDNLVDVGPLDPSGDSFAVGDGIHSISCTATDAAGNSAGATESFSVDQTAPVITDDGPTTSPNGNGWYNADVTNGFSVDAGVSGADASCDAAFPGGSQSKTTSGEGLDVTVTSDGCTDLAGNTATGLASAGFDIDETAPVITGDASPDANTNGWNNTDVTVTFTCADPNGTDPSGIDTDTVAGDTLSGEGAGQSVTSTGDCIDMAGNAATAATASGINIDKTAPVISDDGPTAAANVNGWYNADVTNDFSVDADISGPDAACAAAFPGGSQSRTTTGEGTALNVTSDGCTDLAGNTASGVTSANFSVDKTAPTAVAFSATGLAEGGSYYFGSVPLGPSSCSANYDISGSAGCVVSGYGTSVGAHTVQAAATDLAGNVGSASINYTVLAWSLTGFYNPVDMGGYLNVVKGGSTVPLKFEVFAGAAELTSVTSIKGFKAVEIGCGALVWFAADEIEITSTGGTSLRYDSTGGQFIQNWQTPKNKVGTCWAVTMTTQDGSSLNAFFKLK